MSAVVHSLLEHAERLGKSPRYIPGQSSRGTGTPPELRLDLRALDDTTLRGLPLDPSLPSDPPATGARLSVEEGAAVAPAALDAKADFRLRSSPQTLVFSGHATRDTLLHAARRIPGILFAIAVPCALVAAISSWSWISGDPRFFWGWFPFILYLALALASPGLWDGWMLIRHTFWPRLVVTLPGAPLMSLEQGTLSDGEISIELDQPFRMHLTRSPAPESMLLNVELDQGGTSLAFRVPVETGPQMEALEPYALDAPLLSAEDVHDMLWPALMAYAEAQGHDAPWHLARTRPA